MTTWFAERARSLGLDVSPDDAGNTWAWWWAPAGVTGAADAAPAGVALGGQASSPSQLSTPALPFDAIERLRTSGFSPARPIGVAEFSQESLPDLRTHNPPIVALVEIVNAPGSLLTGNGASDPGSPIGIGTRVWPWGRWRVDLTGPGGRAGVVPLDRRDDPLQEAARLIQAAREMAYRYSALATTGRMFIEPNDPDEIPTRIQVWLDACAPSEVDLLDLVQEFVRMAAESGAKITEEHWASSIDLDHDLAGRIARIAGPLPVVASGTARAAGTAAAQGVPSVALLMRDAEHTRHDDHQAGISALAGILAELAGA